MFINHISKIKYLLLYFIFYHILVPPLMAQEAQYQYNFLKLPISAKVAALGGENISTIEDDQTLMFANPALAVTNNNFYIGLNYTNYMQGCNFMGISAYKSIEKKISIGGGIQYMDYGKLKRTDHHNNNLGIFRAKDIAIQGILAYKLYENIVGGITTKFITSYIDSYNSIAIGVDIGINYYNPEKRISISAVAKNLGGEIKAYHSIFGKMPIDMQLGITKQLEGLPLQLSLTVSDLTHFNYKFINHITLGSELILSKSIWVGAGYNFRKANEMKLGRGDTESSHGAGFSVGAGFNLEQIKLDIAYAKYHATSNSIVINFIYNI